MPRLIVNGDDLGFSIGANLGILKAHHHGIVTSTTVMINMPAAEQGLQDALEFAPGLGIGLHVNLCEGVPVSNIEDVSTLVDDEGQFYPPAELMNVAMQFDAGELSREIHAQFDRFVEITGQKPTHLDSHYHVSYLHPFALEAKLALARDNGNLALRNFSPTGDDDDMLIMLQAFLPEIDTNVMRQILPMLRDIFESAPTPPNMPTKFIADFSGDHIALGDLLNVLMTLPEGQPAELLCHPGQAPDPTHPKIERRQQELEQLMHPTTLEVIERYDIELIHYGQLSREAST